MSLESGPRFAEICCQALFLETVEMQNGCHFGLINCLVINFIVKVFLHVLMFVIKLMHNFIDNICG